jgi:type IV fimbrial biogenesis protein FimT
MRAGFSLLELMIVMTLLGISLMMIIPRFDVQMEQGQLKSAVSEVQALVFRARALAISHHQPLWLHVISPNIVFHRQSASHRQSPLYWQIIVNTSEAFDQGNQLLSLSGERYPKIMLRSRLSQKKLFIDGRTGKMSNGTMLFSIRDRPERKIKLVTSHGAGRVRSCSVGTVMDGYPTC